MNVELSHEDLMLMELILSKEESEAHVEIHHTRNLDYKEYLKKQQEHVRDLLARIRNALQDIPH